MQAPGETNNSIRFQYFFVRGGGWRIFNNRTNANKRWKMAGAVELDWLVEIDTCMAVRMRDL